MILHYLLKDKKSSLKKKKTYRKAAQSVGFRHTRKGQKKRERERDRGNRYLKYIYIYIWKKPKKKKGPLFGDISSKSYQEKLGD